MDGWPVDWLVGGQGWNKERECDVRSALGKGHGKCCLGSWTTRLEWQLQIDHSMQSMSDWRRTACIGGLVALVLHATLGSTLNFGCVSLGLA